MLFFVAGLEGEVFVDASFVEDGIVEVEGGLYEASPCHMALLTADPVVRPSTYQS